VPQKRLPELKEGALLANAQRSENICTWFPKAACWAKAYESYRAHSTRVLGWMLDSAATLFWKIVAFAHYQMVIFR
jgi:hypothetical protein